MNQRIGLLLGLGAILTLLIAGSPRFVRADGGVFPPPHMSDVAMPAQKAIIVYDAQRGHEDLILSVDLLSGSRTGGEGPVVVRARPTAEEGAASAAWVVPLPSLPEVKAASHRWFEQLGDLTKPKVETRVEYVSYLIVEKAVEKEGGVEVLSREQVGVYDVSILSADEPGALLEWLNEHGYAFPEEGGPLLDLYVKEGGWYFVAARVLPGESAYFEGDVQPLWFSFDAERPIYPMRLTALVENDIDVLIYVLADHRMDIKSFNFVTEFAGELELKNHQENDAELVDLLTHRPYYVTKLRAYRLFPLAITKDLYLERAASDEPHRMVLHRTEYRYRPATVLVTERPTAEPEREPSPTEPERKPSPTELESERPTGRFWDWLLENKGWLGWCVGLALIGLLAGLGLAWRRRSRRKPDQPTDHD